MIMALYGHPRAGDLWADKLGGVLRADNFTNVTGWPSMYIKNKTGEIPQVFDVYVDDLIMLGSREGLGDTLSRIRKEIDMEDPHGLGKYLGCYHRIVEEVCPRTKAVVTKVEWDMSAYTRRFRKVLSGVVPPG